MFNEVLEPRVGLIPQPFDILDRPQCVARGRELLVSCLDVNHRIQLFSVDAYEGTYTTAASGIVARHAPGIAVFNGMTALAIDCDDDTISLSLTPSITAPLNPVVLPFTTYSPLALAQAQGRLLLLWQAPVTWSLHLAVSTDGATFIDHDLGIRANHYALFADDATSGEAILAWNERTASGEKVCVGALDPTAPGNGLARRLEFDTDAVRHVGIGSTRWHGTSHIVVTYTTEIEHAGRQSEYKVTARRIKPTLAPDTLLGPEQGTVAYAYGVSIARAELRTWIVWRDMFSDPLRAMPYELAFDLPPEYHAALGRKCDETACMVDPRLICAPTDEIAPVWEAARIVTGRKGDLVVTPADGVGFIGSFLKELTYPQLYDHMGMLVEDETVVRHCTMGHDRAQDKRYYRGSFSIAGIDLMEAPTEGFEPNVMQFGWPGSITQTVQDAFYDGFDNADVAMAARMHPARQPYIDPTTAGWPTGKRASYNIHNMTGQIQLRPDGTLVSPLLVRPDPVTEANDPELRSALHRVADASKLVRGHYRFYSYTDATIAENPLYVPTTLTGDRDGWANGTLPLVCSSFIWEAVRHANRSGALPMLRLEGESENTPEELYRALVNQPDSDGLYRYYPDERLRAAHALHDELVRKVQQQIWNQIVALSGPVGTAQEVGLIVGLGLGLLVGPAAMAWTAIASLLGVRVETVQAIVDLLEDLPARVANQMCMTFAKDRPDLIDSTDWQAPGPGVAIAPQDCVHLWDVARIQSPHDRVRLGLWGDAVPLPLRPRAYVRRRVHRYERGKGLARVYGQVTFNGTPVAGATVHLACESLLTDREGSYRALVAGGPQEVWAAAVWISTGALVESERIRFDASPGPDDTPQDIKLLPPPDTRRLLITTQDNIDFVHQVMVGHDSWMHDHRAIYEIFEQRFDDDPRGSYFSPAPAPPAVDPATHRDWWWVSDFASHNRVRLHFQGQLITDIGSPDYLGIKVDVRFEYLEDFLVDNDDEDRHDDRPAGDALIVSDGASGIVPRDGSASITIDLKSGGIPPDRAWLKLTFENRVFPM